MKFLTTLFILILIACGDDQSVSQDTSDPSNLVLDVTISVDGSGLVVFNASADNAVRYELYQGVGNADPVSSTDGHLEHVYMTSGSYLVEVRAYGSSGKYVSVERRINVQSGDPVSTGEGYSTPFSYENMDLVWNDEFNEQFLNDEYWSYDLGTGCPDLCGWGNNELEHYRQQNVRLEDGVLVIEAREETYQGSNYTSGKIVTRDKVTANHGRIDIRAVLPQGQGIWPALWMLGINQPTVGWPKCGEIDIMEMIGGSGRENTVSGNAYWYDNGKLNQPDTYTLSEGTFSGEYRVFSLIWDDQELCWYVDDQVFHTLDISSDSMDEFLKPFYLIFNVAVGGDWPGSPDATTIFPTQMRVDYVRIFQDQ